MFFDPGDADVGWTSFALLGVAALGASESVVVSKLVGRQHPMAMNAVGMTAGSVALLTVAVLGGDELVLPRERDTQLAVAYLVAATVGMFLCILYVVQRWTASATAYTFVSMPVVAVLAAAALLDEPITAAVVAGGAIVVAGSMSARSRVGGGGRVDWEREPLRCRGAGAAHVRGDDRGRFGVRAARSAECPSSCSTRGRAEDQAMRGFDASIACTAAADRANVRCGAGRSIAAARLQRLVGVDCYRRQPRARRGEGQGRSLADRRHRAATRAEAREVDLTPVVIAGSSELPQFVPLPQDRSATPVARSTPWCRGDRRRGRLATSASPLGMLVEPSP